MYHILIFLFTRDQDWDFLPFRVWVGLWTGLFILLIVAFDLSALVRYITRFTEESFACLIALIFIYEAFKKTFEIETDFPVHFKPPKDFYGCFCAIDNRTFTNSNLTDEYVTSKLIPNLTETTTNLVGLNRTGPSQTTASISTTSLSQFETECLRLGGSVTGDACAEKYVSDVFFFSLLLFIGTFFLATVLVRFRHSLFFPTFVSTLQKNCKYTAEQL